MKKTIAPSDKRSTDRLLQILHEYVDEMREHFLAKAGELESDESRPGELAVELREAAEIYHRQAHEAVDLIEQGGLTPADLRHVAGTLFLTSLVLRWVLEQRTVTFQALLADPSPELGGMIAEAWDLIEQGKEEEGFRKLLRLVEVNRESYPLLMNLGFVYLRVKKNLEYALRYFEKAAQTTTKVEPSHYRVLALEFIAACHEGQGNHKNALNTLLLAEKVGVPNEALFYSIARTYAQLSREKKAIEYFERAIRSHPAFYSMALVDSAFDTIRGPLEEKIREHNNLWRNFAQRFLHFAERILIPIQDLQLEESSKSLAHDSTLLRRHLALVNLGCYSGWRTGIVRSFQGLFPEIMHEIDRALARKSRSLAAAIRLHNSRLSKRMKVYRWVFTPLLALGLASLAYFTQDGLLALSPVKFHYMGLILPVTGALFGSWLALELVSVRERKGLRSAEEVRAIARTQVGMRRLEGEIQQFWMKEVSRHVVEIAVWET